MGGFIYPLRGVGKPAPRFAVPPAFVDALSTFVYLNKLESFVVLWGVFYIANPQHTSATSTSGTSCTQHNQHPTRLVSLGHASLVHQPIATATACSAPSQQALWRSMRFSIREPASPFPLLWKCFYDSA